MDFEELAQGWSLWSLQAFPKADAYACANKLKEEVRELREAIALEGQEEVREEAADVLLCLLNITARQGITPAQLLQAAEAKMAKNKKRRWRLNDNNTYSHVKRNDGASDTAQG